MSDDPVFVYAAVYAGRDDADADYDTLLDPGDRGGVRGMTSQTSQATCPTASNRVRTPGASRRSVCRESGGSLMAAKPRPVDVAIRTASGRVGARAGARHTPTPETAAARTGR